MTQEKTTLVFKGRAHEIRDYFKGKKTTIGELQEREAELASSYSFEDFLEEQWRAGSL